MVIGIILLALLFIAFWVKALLWSGVFAGSFIADLADWLER